ncbi:hypothetical protein [Streptomyces clavuligerus]|nr:hypothetical protein [Streptomyces clavuligerus]
MTMTKRAAAVNANSLSVEIMAHDTSPCAAVSTVGTPLKRATRTQDCAG